MLNECERCHERHKLTRHHIIPQCRNGTNDPQNIAHVCRPCHDVLDAELGLRGKNPAPVIYRECGDCGRITRKLNDAGLCRICRDPARREIEAKRQAIWEQYARPRNRRRPGQHIGAGTDYRGVG